MKRLLFLFFFFASLACGQTNIASGPVNPAVCNPAIGSLFFNNSTNPGIYYYCSATNTWSQISAAAGSGNSVGPVLNAASGGYGIATTNADNATGMAALATAANAAAYVSLGVPTVRAVTQTPSISQTTFTLPVVVQNGDTVIIGIIGGFQSGHVISSISDGVNVYSPQTIPLCNTVAICEQIWSTRAGGAQAVTGNVTVTNSGVDFIGGFAAVVFNVGSFGNFGAPATGSSTAPAITLAATHDANNLMLTAIGWNNATSTTATANVGTLQSTFVGNNTQQGGALVTNLQVALGGTPTTSVTLANSSLWTAYTMELRSVALSVPTVYFPTGTYNYTSGLQFNNPVTVKGEPGSVLCYNGSAHAMDLGPAGLVLANYQSVWYTVDGLNFQCGQKMTQGIYIANLVLMASITNNTFLNFGPGGTAYAIYAAGNQNDVNVFGNKHIVNDGYNPTFPGTTGIPRGFVQANVNSTATTLRIENNAAYCASGLYGNVGCNTVFGTSPALISTFGLTHIITGNNFMGGFCPAIQLLNGDNNTHIEANHFETDTSTCPAITFQTNVQGLKVINNYFKATGATFIAPQSGTELLVGAEVSYNNMTVYPLATPLVKLNNLGAQTANLAWHNTCGVAAVSIPCPLTHTIGGSISPWNADWAGSCTMNGSTGCPAISFTNTYGVAPTCTATWNGTGSLTGIVKAVSSATTLTISSSVSGDTAVMNYSCNPEAQ